MSELANNKSIRKEVQDLGETLGITPNGKTNQQKIRSIGEQASDGTYATKEYVNTLMSGALKRTIVETLPVEDIDTNTIYMVLDQSASQQGNVYNEYLYINNAWELIGTTAVAETVIANPTLAGTEADLTGLEVDGTKYKVPQGSGSNIYRYVIEFRDSSNNILVNINSLSSIDVDMGEFSPLVSNIFPNLSQTQLKALFDLTIFATRNEYIISTNLDGSIYENDSHQISTDSHGYIINNINTSENLVYVDISYDESNDTYAIDTSYKYIGSVVITKYKI